MDELRSIVRQETLEYGTIMVKLSDVMDRRGVTRNRLSNLIGVKYDVIDRYYQGCNIARADLDFLARVCFALNCKIEDLLEYIPPENA